MKQYKKDDVIFTIEHDEDFASLLIDAGYELIGAESMKQPESGVHEVVEESYGEE